MIFYENVCDVILILAFENALLNQVINGLYLAACGIGLATVERLGRWAHNKTITLYHCKPLHNKTLTLWHTSWIKPVILVCPTLSMKAIGEKYKAANQLSLADSSRIKNIKIGSN